MAKQEHNSAIGKRVYARGSGRGGQITAVTKHSSEPWTRYDVNFDDGEQATGLIIGVDVRITPQAFNGPIREK